MRIIVGMNSYIYNLDKIKHIVQRLKPKLLQLTPNNVYKDDKYILCYDQVLIRIKYNKLQNYRKCVCQTIDLLVETNKNSHPLKELLQEIDECINILEPFKQVESSEFQNLALLEIDLEIDLD